MTSLNKIEEFFVNDVEDIDIACCALCKYYVKDKGYNIDGRCMIKPIYRFTINELWKMHNCPEFKEKMS